MVIKEKFFQENSYTEIRKTYFLAPKLGVDLYTGSTYTRVNTVVLMQGEKEAIGLIFRWYSSTIAHYKLQPDELTAVVML